MNWKKILLAGALALAVAGCSSEEEPTEEAADPVAAEQTEEQEAKEQESQEQTTQPADAWWEDEFESYELTDINRDLTEEEQEMIKKEGEFSGTNYDKAAVEAKLDELPKDVDEETIKRAILHLVREDYHEEVETFIKFDPTVNVDKTGVDEEVEGPQATSGTHFAILLDASGSMGETADGSTRMEVAKQAIDQFIGQLPENGTVSLRVYGHEGTGSDADKEKSCASTEMLYSGKIDQSKISDALSSINPAGWTPIARAIEESQADIPENASSAVTYVVSDGIETCDGNPVAAAKKLSEAEIQPIINIIGFQVDNEAQQQLQEVASAGGGTFTYASSKHELDEYWNEEYDRLQDAWEEWQQEGMEKADEISDQLMEKAGETGNSIMDKSDLEWKHAEDAITYLEEEHEMEQAGDVWSHFYDRSKMTWGYGYDNKTDNWQEAYHNGVDMWQYFYHTGNDKWTEYYEKKK
ncbi:vWA domain-containing protein [Thalassobacillus hwangdonensis]|uniref:VWA domain-containing protein n=1 Tax=Thalassobacillus hwangdonensis TaxID=546108 RepID=A0ABW3L530_9BACI